MLYTIPDYYQNFKCTADECEDTCCAGWQIAIDRKSLVRYGKVSGKFRRRLNRSIRWLEGTFKQGEGGKSVFGVIVFIVAFIVGHTFNIAINLLGAYVHTNRLQYVEFFGKFYEGGGRAFNPFKENTKYADIKEETNL